MITDTPISDAAIIYKEPYSGLLAVPYTLAQELERKVARLEAAAWLWKNKFERECISRKAEIESLRARNDKLYTDYINERILRHEAEAAVDRARLAIASLEAKCNSETERCAKVAADYGMSPVVGKAIAALILRIGE